MLAHPLLIDSRPHSTREILVAIRVDILTKGGVLFFLATPFVLDTLPPITNAFRWWGKGRKVGRQQEFRQLGLFNA
ncbi:hypothetical protein SCLCIDRAFT_1015982 [Scleroderma citrinum Foug A]|uniref:Uncharacterized protein n=1 Tax=Scleroderma citrinum Foug A TaxID=1036808 RepID=A0A0C3ATJ7_9AGAM|nr:hypothetical protein SCLCIDRAFT_1015982 [Scleroderma citrinum Foug A]